MSVVDADRPTARRLRTDSTSQGLLLTLLGDYWFGRTGYIPSAALVALLAEFGISAQAARAALSRVQRAGYLEGARQGRNTSYRLSELSAERGLVSGRRIMRFTAERPADVPPWDGRWTIVTYALQTEQADERRRIRRRLRALGFGPLQDAVWISPHPAGRDVLEELDEAASTSLTVFEQATLSPSTDLDPVRIWRLDELARRYRASLDHFGEVLPHLTGRRRPSPPEALVMRTLAMERWRVMPLLDPRLPAALLPPRWPGWEARRRFAQVYDRLGPPAAARVREVVAPFSEEAAAAVRHDSVAEPR
jgi:phenylacetic acid degradation operon negative regulatory protein